MLTPDVEDAVERYHRAVEAFVNGDARPEKQLFSHRDDVTLANPLGPPSSGWNEVEQALDRAVAFLREAEAVRFERVTDQATDDLAFIHEIERVRLRFAGSADFAPVSLRVTTVFRREADGWRVLHRHADPVTGPRNIESVVER